MVYQTFEDTGDIPLLTQLLDEGQRLVSFFIAEAFDAVV
jgi:hypothetical protein